MRKPDFCLWENKAADQLCSNCEADQRLSFRYLDSTVPLRTTYSQIFKSLACFFDCKGRFVSDLFENPEDRISRVAALMIMTGYYQRPNSSQEINVYINSILNIGQTEIVGEYRSDFV